MNEKLIALNLTIREEHISTTVKMSAILQQKFVFVFAQCDLLCPQSQPFINSKISIS